MADRGENSVVLGCRQLPDQAAAALPGRTYAGHVLRTVFRQWRQHHLLIAIKIRPRGQRTTVFRAGDRMGGNELPDPVAKMHAGCRDHVLLGTASVSNHRLPSQARSDAGHDLRSLANWRGDQYEVSTRHLLPDVETDAVENPQLQRLVQRTQRAPETDDLACLPGGLQRQCEGAADQTDAENDNLVEHW
jgi:hypothetical protein